MKLLQSVNHRTLSIAGFSLLFAYLLSFLFEGQVLYSLLEVYRANARGYIFAVISAHVIGLFSCGFFVKSPIASKRMLIGGMGLCSVATIPFFFPPTLLWSISLMISGFASGCALAAWGYFLKAYTPKNERIKSCADALIGSNLFMIAINVIAIHISPIVGLTFAILCVLFGMILIQSLPVDAQKNWLDEVKREPSGDIFKPLMMLCLFVFVITINSGLMYQVINPAFSHLTWLTSWYWAVPYLIALAILRNLPAQAKRSRMLYVGMAMIMAAFISFMLLGQNAFHYLVVDTLMLGACGIFDLFWWSILGEMLDYTQNPVKLFGVGLSANVFGVLCGGVLGLVVTAIKLPEAEVAVIALTIVCITLILLPSLNRQLLLLLKSHTYLAAYSEMTPAQQSDFVQKARMREKLTLREQEVLMQILSGKSNRSIAETLCITESTVKTHARNLYSKYDVGSRAELISSLLKNQVDATSENTISPASHAKI